MRRVLSTNKMLNSPWLTQEWVGSRINIFTLYRYHVEGKSVLQIQHFFRAECSLRKESEVWGAEVLQPPSALSFRNQNLQTSSQRTCNVGKEPPTVQSARRMAPPAWLRNIPTRSPPFQVTALAPKSSVPQPLFFGSLLLA